MYVCMYVCMYSLCVYTRIHVCMLMYTYTSTHIFSRVDLICVRIYLTPYIDVFLS